MSLTLSVYSDEYAWSARDIAGSTYAGMAPDLPLADLKRTISSFSTEVERRNPDWRSLIR